jgi:lipoate-protein ligase A
MALLSSNIYLGHFDWLENGSDALCRYIDIKNGIEDVATAEARQYNQACGKATITSVADTTALPEDFRDQLTERFFETFEVEIDAANISNAKTLENIAEVIFQIYEQKRAQARQ